MAFQQGGGQQAKGVVKWFNTTKGFGFVALEDNGGEVFLHMSALEAAGLPAPAEGAAITCEIGAGKKGPQVTRPRAPSSINHELAILRAAVNKVPAPGTPGTDAAWQEALRAIRNADRQHTLYLDRDQRRLPLQKIDPEAEPFVRTLWRPGAVARLTVADFDARTSELSIGHDKSGKPRRILIPSKAAELLGARAEGRAPRSPPSPRERQALGERNV